VSAVNGKPDALERVGIVGGGIMGTGIAEVCAKTGLDLILVEVNETVAETARARVQHSLDPAVRGDKLGAEAAAQALARLRCVDDFDSLADRQIVIEAVVEDRDVKLNVFDRLRRVVKHHEAILASNTSSIPIVELATATGDRADHVLGLTSSTPFPCSRWSRSSRRC
jgi:3-hydroxybutyryl-CoA dehydrogenase